MADRPLAWRLAWRIARRDLSQRLKGLRLLVVCLFLGVATISAIGTLTGSIERELANRGQEILGGDLEVGVWQRAFSTAERRALEALGKVSSGLRMQAIAVAGENSAPIALKAVDGSWPLVSRLRLKDGRMVGAPAEGEAWLSEGTMERLGIAVGDRFRIGTEVLAVGGVLTEDPEQLAEGLSLGNVAITREDLPARAGLTAPGAMFQSKTRVLLRPGLSPEAASALLEKQFPSAGFEIRTRSKAAPGVERFVERMSEFLVLVGLAALVIAGIGIGGGVASYLEARRASIATLKVLGATSGDIARIYLLQIAAASLVGSIAGLAAGVVVTPLLSRALGALLPVSPGLVFDPAALGLAATYGLLVALVFAAPPLLRARAFPVMALMRARVNPLRLPRLQVLLPSGLGLAAIIGLALLAANIPRITALALASAAGVLGLLYLIGWAIRLAAARLPSPQHPLLRVGLANLHRSGAQTGALVVALGFGLSAFVLLAAVQSALDANIKARIPARAPAYFVLDIPRDREGEFRKAVHEVVPQAEIRSIPNLRGRILAYGPAGRMTRVADLEEIPDRAWPLRGERGITYSQTIPEGNEIVAGAWWPADWRGEPLVSVDRDFAEAIGLKVGDQLTIGLLGIERTMRVANLRRVKWENMTFNHSLVFSPNALEDAPHNLAATIEIPPGVRRQGMVGRLVRAFPSSSVIETGPLLIQARAILGQMSVAILAAASVAVLAGLAVLLGTIAAARASRTYDNVVLRLLGASRRQLLILQLVEYGLLAGVLAGLSLLLGSAVGWAVIFQLFDFDWLPHWPTVLSVLAAGLATVMAFALAASLPLLQARPASALREL